MHMGDDGWLAGREVENPDSMARARTRVISVSIRRKAAVHKTLSLRNNRDGFTHESRQPPLRGISCLPVPEVTL
ncbi:hypothetical protein D3C87_1529880 [compost metagenome]